MSCKLQNLVGDVQYYTAIKLLLQPIHNYPRRTKINIFMCIHYIIYIHTVYIHEHIYITYASYVYTRSYLLSLRTRTAHHLYVYIYLRVEYVRKGTKEFLMSELRRRKRAARVPIISNPKVARVYRYRRESVCVRTLIIVVCVRCGEGRGRRERKIY